MKHGSHLHLYFLAWLLADLMSSSLSIPCSALSCCVSHPPVQPVFACREPAMAVRRNGKHEEPDKHCRAADQGAEAWSSSSPLSLLPSPVPSSQRLHLLQATNSHGGAQASTGPGAAMGVQSSLIPPAEYWVLLTAPHLPAPSQALPSCVLILLWKPPNYYGGAACSSLG